MARYIDAEKLLENLKNQYGEELGWQCTVNMSDVGMMIEDTPTADVEEVKHGEWENIRQYEFGECYSNCSVCETTIKASHPTGLKLFNRFCPMCGAKMDGERKENE